MKSRADKETILLEEMKREIANKEKTLEEFREKNRMLMEEID